MHKNKHLKTHTRASIAAWKIPGVVSDENVMVLDAMARPSSPAPPALLGGAATSASRNCCTIVVFALPGPPTTSAGCGG